MLVALLHYNMDIPLVICFTGNNNTGAYIDVPQILKTVKLHIPLEIFENLEQILTVGTPTNFNGESSQENYNEYQRYINHPTVAKYDKNIAKIINKEERKKHLMILPL